MSSLLSMQRASVSSSSAARSQAPIRVALPCQVALSGRRMAVQAVSRRGAVRGLQTLQATPKEEAEIEAMKQAMAKDDVWESDIIATVFKVIIVAGIIGWTALLVFAGEPWLQNIINSFPHPTPDSA